MSAPGYLREGYKASKRRRPKQSEKDGRVVGFETEHWDGRQDAQINADSVRIGFGIPGPATERDAVMRARAARGAGKAKLRKGDSDG